MGEGETFSLSLFLIHILLSILFASLRGFFLSLYDGHYPSITFTSPLTYRRQSHAHTRTTRICLTFDFTETSASLSCSITCYSPSVSLKRTDTQSHDSYALITHFVFVSFRFVDRTVDSKSRSVTSRNSETVQCVPRVSRQCTLYIIVQPIERRTASSSSSSSSCTAICTVKILFNIYKCGSAKCFLIAVSRLSAN